MSAGARRRAGVLVSGAGSNLRALLDACAAPDYPAAVVAVASNRPGCPALALARARGIPVAAIPVGRVGGDPVRRDAELAAWLGEHGAELLVCAGYDRIIQAPLLERFRGRILNVHPSLLPAFAGGMHAVEAALSHGVRVTGCTVHLVDEGGIDAGPIVAQEAVPVLPGDTPDRLRARIHEAEWRLLPAALASLASGRLIQDGRRVRVGEGPA